MPKAAIPPSIDETDLLRRAEPFVAQLQGELPAAPRLHELTKQQGLDLATMVFYQAILASSAYCTFRDTLVHLPAEPVAGAIDAKVLIVPALLYAERPALGGDGKAIADIARARGFTTELIPIHSKGSMQANARLIWERIAQESCQKLWIVSLSKGGGEVRLALQAHVDHPALAKVRGWINVCGLVKGSPLFDRYRLRMWIICRLLGADRRNLTELRASYPPWQMPCHLPPDLQVINVLGVPLQAHIHHRNMLWRYTHLGRLGPNDGLALLPDLVMQPGLIYPVWGADHFLQTPQAAPLFQKIFNYARLRTCPDWETANHAG